MTIAQLLPEENNEEIGDFKQRHGGAADEETHEAADCGEELPLVDKRLLVDCGRPMVSHRVIFMYI